MLEDHDFIDSKMATINTRNLEHYLKPDFKNYASTGIVT